MARKKSKRDAGASDDAQFESITQRLIASASVLRRSIIRIKLEQQAHLADNTSKDLTAQLERWSEQACNRLNQFFAEVAQPPAYIPEPEEEDKEHQLSMDELLALQSAKNLTFTVRGGRKRFQQWLPNALAQFDSALDAMATIIQACSNEADALYEQLFKEEALPRIKELTKASYDAMWARLDAVPNHLLLPESSKKRRGKESADASLLADLTRILQVDRETVLDQAATFLNGLAESFDRALVDKRATVNEGQIELARVRKRISAEATRQIAGPDPKNQ